MKPSIPETGTIIRLEGENAVVVMKTDGSCRKCGAAALGLCKAGQTQVLTVRNPSSARVGDSVKIGLVQKVQYKGYVLAYAVPCAGFVFGAAAGHWIGTALSFPQLDIVAGFFSLFAASFLSLRRLKRLSSSSSIEIVHVLSDRLSPGFPRPDEEPIPDEFRAYIPRP